jgi:hypothetical protein
MARSLNCALVKLGQQKEGALWTLVKDQIEIPKLWSRRPTTFAERAVAYRRS